MQEQIDDLSNNTTPSSDEEMSPEVLKIKYRPAHTFDLEDDPLLACEGSEGDWCRQALGVALIRSSPCATRLRAAHSAYTYPEQPALSRHRQNLPPVTTAVERCAAILLLRFLGGGGNTLSRKGSVTRVQFGGCSARVLSCGC